MDSVYLFSRKLAGKQENPCAIIDKSKYVQAAKLLSARKQCPGKPHIATVTLKKVAS